MIDFSVVGLRVLAEVAVRGSFTAAAESLGYTQSAVSRQVAALELAAGARLFERVARGVRLTEAGSTLARHANAVIDQLDAARLELSDASRPPVGRLRIGAFPTAIASLLPRAIAAFRVTHPGIALSLREGTTPFQLKRLGSGATDLAVIGTPNTGSHNQDFVFEALLEDPLLLAVGRTHRLAGRRTVELDDLAGEAWIAGSREAHDTLLGAWPALAWQPNVEFVAREWTAKLGLVAAGLGVTVVPGLAASAVRTDVMLLRVRSDTVVARSVAMATPRRSEQPPTMGAFAEALHRVAADLATEVQRRIDQH